VLLHRSKRTVPVFYLVISADLELNHNSAGSLAKYMKSKFVRFLQSLAKNSQYGTRNTYSFVPMRDFESDSSINW
jgi:hypothetical protein